MRGNKFLKILDFTLGVPILFLFGLIRHFLPEKEIVPGAIKKILVIKLSALGDTVLLLPVLRTLKENIPTAKIYFLATGINRKVLENCPDVDQLLELKLKDFLTNPFYLFSFIGGLRRERFDIAFDFDQWLRLSAILSFLSGAKLMVGFRTPGQLKHLAFDRVIFHRRNRHEVDCFLDLVAFLNLKKIERIPRIEILEDWRKKSVQFLKSIGIEENEDFVIFHPEVPRHAFPRQWPEENFIQLAKELIKKHPLKILITGTERSKEIFQHRKMIDEERIKSAVSLEWDLLLAIIKRAKLLVCGNTGIMHLAAAIGTPVVALHGPTDPVKWGPLGDKNIVVKSKLPCSPCLYLGFEYGCQTNRCMQEIKTEDVLAAVETFL